MYDALIEDYGGEGRDLLIEVKSSVERGVLRLAVGQLLDYRWGVPRRDVTDIAVLLPERPDDDALAFLRRVGVMVLWFGDQELTMIDGDRRLGVPQPA